MGDPWLDARLYDVFKYLYHGKHVEIPNSWITVMARFEAELRQLEPHLYTFTLKMANSFNDPSPFLWCSGQGMCEWTRSSGIQCCGPVSVTTGLWKSIHGFVLLLCVFTQNCSAENLRKTGANFHKNVQTTENFKSVPFEITRSLWVTVFLCVKCVDQACQGWYPLAVVL